MMFCIAGMGFTKISYYMLLSTEFCTPLPNSYFEALMPNITVFGDRTCKEIFKVKWIVRVRRP